MNIFHLASIVLMALVAGCAKPATETWETLGDGLELAQFPLPESAVGGSTVMVVRIDPSKFAVRALTAAEGGHGSLRADEWAKRYDLSVVINAGMFELDHSTHVGYMRTSTVVNQEAVHPEYSSVFAFDPIDANQPAVQMFDTDETDFEAEILPNYRAVLQNLRLIKRPGENRWSQQEKQWSEMALGQDKAGNVLLIFCRSPYSMHDLNLHLLDLPIDLVCAQHLEGGPEASLYLKHGGTELRQMGSYETGFNESDGNREFWPIPNIIGFEPKPATSPPIMAVVGARSSCLVNQQNHARIDPSRSVHRRRRRASWSLLRRFGGL